MVTFEIIKPGVWLNHYDDSSINYTIRSFLDSFIDCFYEANQSLNLFDLEYEEPTNLNIDDWEKRREERISIGNELKAEIGEEEFYNNYEENSFRVEVILKRKQFDQGIIPERLKRKNIFIYAKSFLFALDNFQKLFYSLLQQTNSNHLPMSLGTLYNDFCSHFINLKDVRNSAHHFEDRIQGLAFGKPINIQPLANEFFQGNGILVLGALTNRKYGTTLANGSYGEVEVSSDSLIKVQLILQSILDAFTWNGSKEYYP